MSEVQEAEVLRKSPIIGEHCVFIPSERFRKKYRVPKAKYLALVIGIQQLNKQPILRVYNPYAGHVELPKQMHLPKTAIKANLGPFELHTDVGGPKAHMEDWTVWCEPTEIWGRWE